MNSANEIIDIIHLINWRLVKITGANAESFLQGQLTCDVTEITEKKCALGALCNHQGRVLAILTLFKKQQDYFCLLPNLVHEKVIDHLSKFAVFSKVHLEDVTANFFLYGCLVEDSLRDIFPEFPENDHDVVAQEQLTLVKFPGISPRYLICSQVKLDHKTITQNDWAWKLISISSGYASIYTQTMGTVTPHMLNLPLLGAVSFDKGCYVGQEIVARTHYLGKSKRHLCQANILANVEIEPGELVFSGEQEAGIVMDSIIVHSTTLLLAVLAEPLDKSFTVKGYDLQEVIQMVHPLPLRTGVSSPRRSL